jgi:hypothetical protein
LAVGSRTAATVKIKNYGVTPAVRVRSEGGFFPALRNEDEVYNMPGPYRPGATLMEDKTFAPGVDYPPGTLFSDRWLTEEQLALIRSKGVMVLVFYGTVLYFDVFRAEHYSNFCFYFDNVPPPSVIGAMCRNHNDSD